MKYTRLFLLYCASILMCLSSASLSFAQSEIAIVSAMLIDGYETPPIHDSVVLISGTKIVAAGPRHTVNIPDKAHIIDARGKTVMPGLIDLHMHLDLIGHGDYDQYYQRPVHLPILTTTTSLTFENYPFDTLATSLKYS